MGIVISTCETLGEFTNGGMVVELETEPEIEINRWDG